MRYQFNQFEIDTLQFKLFCADKMLAIEPKDFDLLLYLVKNSHRLVTRDEIFANVWQGHSVGEATLSNHIKTVRKILGDNGDEQSVIATLRGRGYQFVAETQEIPQSKETVLTTHAPHRRTIHLIIILLILLVGIAGTFFESFGYGREANRLIIIVLALDLIAVLIFSWVYEYKSEELVKDSEIDSTKVSTIHINQKLDLLIIGLLVIGIGYFIWDSRFNDVDSNDAVDVTQVTSTSIAVLPFVNMSSDPEQEYFSDGISEEILNVLAKIPNLHVTSRSSSFAFKGKSHDLTKVAKQLGVNHILEGSVRISGTTVRITAQLIEAVSDRHLWSETYDRELTDVFAIQDELSAAIVDVLKIKLMGAPPEQKAVLHKVTPEAHTAYLKGLYYYRNLISHEKDLPKALKYFDDAIKLDNNYALAHAYRGLTMMILTRTTDLSLTEGSQIARKSIDRAIEIDPELAVAYIYRALNKLWFDFNFKGYRLDLELAKTLNPNIADVHISLSNLHSIQGNPQQAMLYAQKAKTLDPMNRLALNFLADAYFYLGDYQQALLEIEEALTLFPGHGAILMLKARVELAIGNYQQALLISDEMVLEESSVIIRSMAYSKMADKTKSDEELATLIKLAAQHSAFRIAEVYCFRGDNEQCLNWLDEAYKQKDPSVVDILISPFLKPVYQENRYKELVLKMDIL